MMNRIRQSISTILMSAFLLTSAVAQSRPQQKASPKATPQPTAQQNGTPGKIAKFTDTKYLADSNISEDGNGKVGIGTTIPTSMLTVNGFVEMMSAQSGLKFADGTMQTTAGLTTVARDNTLKGNGTPASPLGLPIPLKLNTYVQFGSVIEVSNGNVASHGITSTGGADGGIGLRGYGTSAGLPGNGVLGVGGDSATLGGGFGVGGGGGHGDSGSGGVGVSGGGGWSRTGSPGAGVSAGGGSIFYDGVGNGGPGMRTTGGTGRGAGKSGGTGIEAFPGYGENGAGYGYAAQFHGDVQVTGLLSKAGGSFKIDHPLDPENKYLSHSFVESPDMMNIYNGNITTNENGEAVVTLPDYFEALNRDFRYQLTVVGQFAQAIVAEEVKGNRFQIRTSAPGVKVSWQVTGVRQDAWANQNRIKIEENKSEKERGHYLHPEAFGKDEERGVEWANRPELMREMKQRRADAEPARQSHQ
jgi:hypothetical protein